MTQIFLDDEREPINSLDYVIVRSYSEFIHAVINADERITFISFDHDLGEDSLDGMACCKYLVGLDMSRNGKLLDKDFTYYVHSQNPIGKENIEGYLDQYLEEIRGA